MAFSDVQARTTITGFPSAADTATILGAMETAYNSSSIARAMFDNWIATPTNTIVIQYEEGKAYSRNSPSGQLFLDLQFIATLDYITPTGQAIEVDPVHVIVHELGHALTGRVDDADYITDYKGSNVIYTNPILTQLGIPERVSYKAAAITGTILERNFQYTNGATIDRAVSSDEDWNSSAAGNSKDLLIGGPSANNLQSGDGDDFLWGAGGDDSLYGGAGTDTVGFKGKPTDYDLRQNPDGSWTSRHVRGAANEGTDTLIDLEKVIFEGGQTFDLKKKGLTYQTDFALVIDTTSSMQDDIDAVKAQGSVIINALFADDTRDARIGIVGFKDTTTGEPTSIILPFTDQAQFEDRKTSALSALNEIGVAGGGDLPETPFNGLLKALDGTMGDWRPGAGVHRVVLFTDAPAKDGFLKGTVEALAADIGATITSSSQAVGTGGTLDTFTLSPTNPPSSSGNNLFPGSGDDEPTLPPFEFIDESPTPDTSTANLEIYTIYTGDLGDIDPDLESIARTTGGSSLVAPTPNDLVSTLLDIIELSPGDTLSPDLELTLAKVGGDVFTLAGTTPKLKVSLVESESKLVNELAVFTVDDADGTIDGLVPGSDEYAQAALAKARPIFSNIADIPNGFENTNLSSLLEFDTTQNLRFILVKNSTLDNIKNGISPIEDLLFSDASLQQITDLGDGSFSLAWNNSSGDTTDFKDLVVTIEATTETSPLGTAIQNQSGAEIIDLQDAVETVPAEVSVYREAAYNNYVGFYRIDDTEGSITDPLTGDVLQPGDAGYIQTAVSNRIAGIDLSVANQSTATLSGEFAPGSLFAPFIIVDASPTEVLDTNTQNDPAVYFAFIGANSDGVDHIRLLANNVFGFEDLPQGGDLDYNDVIVRANIFAA